MFLITFYPWNFHFFPTILCYSKLSKKKPTGKITEKTQRKCGNVLFKYAER